jgi:DNA-binding transcriptional ArsR family regulator
MDDETVPPSPDDMEGELPDADALFGALAAAERRRVLRHLDARESVAVSELADVLVGWRTADGAVGPGEHERVVLALHHVHLPSLAAAGLVDRDGDTVESVPLPEPVRELIQFTQRYERPRGTEGG